MEQSTQGLFPAASSGEGAPEDAEDIKFAAGWINLHGFTSRHTIERRAGEEGVGTPWYRAPGPASLAVDEDAGAGGGLSYVSFVVRLVHGARKVAPPPPSPSSTQDKRFAMYAGD